MSTRHRSLLLFIAVFLLLRSNMLANGKAPQSQHPNTTQRMTLARVVDTMIAKNSERAEALQSYQEKRTYKLLYRGFLGSYHAELVVDMTYRAPNTKKFDEVSQTGSHWVVRHILERLVRTEREAQQDKNRLGVSLNRKNYDFTDLRQQNSVNGCSYSVAVKPWHDSKYLYQGRIWINDQSFAVCKIEAEPSRNPSFWIKHTTISETYHQVGNFWLPEKNDTTSQIRLGGSAMLTIEYSNQNILDAHPMSASTLPPTGP